MSENNLPEPTTGGLSECPDCGLQGTPERIEMHNCTDHAPDCELTHVKGHPNANTAVYARDTNAGPHREIRCMNCERTIECMPVETADWQTTLNYDNENEHDSSSNTNTNGGSK